MYRILFSFFLAVLAGLGSNEAIAQSTQMMAKIVSNCGSAPYAPYLNNSELLTMDRNGNLCVYSGSGGGGSVTQGTSPWVDNISQFGGSNVVTGTGPSGAGIPRFTLSNDSTVGLTGTLPAFASTPTFNLGSSIPAGSNAIGSVSVSNFPSTQPISAAALPLPTGAATAAAQTSVESTPGTAAGTAITVQGSPTAVPQPTTIVPSALSSVGITPVVTSALASSLVLKASAGNLYGVEVTTTTVSGYLMVFNSTAAPADGAVTPVESIAVPAGGSTYGLSLGANPDYYSTGITAVFSSTGPLTKTASATAFIKGRVQ